VVILSVLSHHCEQNALVAREKDVVVNHAARQVNL
jgi:hypothetical protein